MHLQTVVPFYVQKRFSFKAKLFLQWFTFSGYAKKVINIFNCFMIRSLSNDTLLTFCINCLFCQCSVAFLLKVSCQTMQNIDQNLSLSSGARENVGADPWWLEILFASVTMVYVWVTLMKSVFFLCVTVVYICVIVVWVLVDMLC